MNRKKAKKYFKQLRKTDNPFVRIDEFGNRISWHEYNETTEMGWKIVGERSKSAIHHRFCPDAKSASEATR